MHDAVRPDRFDEQADFCRLARLEGHDLIDVHETDRLPARLRSEVIDVMRVGAHAVSARQPFALGAHRVDCAALFGNVSVRDRRFSGGVRGFDV